MAITRYCSKDGQMFDVQAKTGGRYPSNDPAHKHKPGETTRFCGRCGQPIGVLPTPNTIYCASCRDDMKQSGGVAYAGVTPTKPPKPKIWSNVTVGKTPPQMDRQTMAFIRSTLGEEAAQKLERASKVYRFTSVPLTDDHLNAADRYLRFIEGGHQYEDEQAAQSDRKLFAVITDQVLATNITARRIYVSFMSNYRVNKTMGPALKWEGVFVICPEMCGKKFILSVIDQHMKVAHDQRTNYASMTKES